MSSAVISASAGCHSAAAVVVMIPAESDNRAPAPPDADLLGAYVNRPSSGTPCRKGHTETACSQCAYACA